MSGSMFATPQSDGAIVSYDFIDQLYAQDGVDDAIDVVGVHPYGPDLDSVTSQVEDTRKALDKAGSDLPVSGSTGRLGLRSDDQGPISPRIPSSRRACSRNQFRSPLRLARRDRRRGGRLVHVARLRSCQGRVLRMVRQRRPRRRRPRQQTVLARPHRPDRRHSLRAAEATGVRGGRSATAGHRRQDHDRVGGSNARLQAAEQPHVLVVEVDVDVTVELARLVEELAADAGMGHGEAAQDRADVGRPRPRRRTHRRSGRGGRVGSSPSASQEPYRPAGREREPQLNPAGISAGRSVTS